MRNRSAIDVFDNWALVDKDKGMEKGHALSVDRMIEIALSSHGNKKSKINILDLGCGNGWMSKKIAKLFPNINYLGIDGAENMIKKAKLNNSQFNYLCADINQWVPSREFDLMISMEVLYYLDSPSEFLKNFYLTGLTNDSVVVVGMDHYKENLPSLDWPSGLGVHMHTLSIEEWVENFYAAGFSDVSYEQFGPRDDWSGTLIIKATK